MNFVMVRMNDSDVERHFKGGTVILIFIVALLHYDLLCTLAYKILNP